MKRILVIEDDPAILQGLSTSLELEQYEVLTASDGIKGYALAKREQPDLILLDIMLPGKNGYAICRDLRSEGVQTPILMLTSKSDEIDKVMGLEGGADDYVTKPFSVRELLARVRAILRRAPEVAVEMEFIAFGNVTVDFRKMELLKAGSAVRMSARELEVLRFLASHEGEVITREMLLDKVWGYENFPTTRTVDNYILSIRKKIEDDPAHPSHLLTMHTAGYKFVKG